MHIHIHILTLTVVYIYIHTEPDTPHIFLHIYPVMYLFSRFNAEINIPVVSYKYRDIAI